MTDYLLTLLVTCAALMAPVPLAWRLAESSAETADSDLLPTALRFACWWCALQATIAISLGAVRHLSGPELWVVELAVFSAGWALWSGPDFVTRTIHQVSGALQGDHVAITTAMATVLVVLVFTCLQEPIPDYDSLSYHLPVMAQWAQTGSLTMPSWTAALGLTHVARYPFSWEALATIPLLSMGDDSLVSVPTILAWLWYGLSIVVLAERLGASREHAIAAACVTLCVPAVAGNVNTMRVEVPFAAAVISGVAMSMSRAQSDKSAWLCTAALLLGMKASGLAYLALLALWGLWWHGRSQETKPAREGVWLHLLKIVVGTVTLVVTGGFWYLRNWLEFGNPIGLIRVSIGSLTLFPGYDVTPPLRRTTLASVFDPTSFADWQVLVQALVVQLSLPFVALVLAAAGLALSRNRSSGGRALAWPAGLCLAAAMLLAYVSTPFTGDNGTNGLRVTPWIAQGLRFALPFVGVVGAVAALGMEHWRPARTHTAILVAGAAIWEATNLTSVKVTLTAASIVLALAGLVWALLWVRATQPRRWTLVGTRLAFVMVVAMLATGAYQLRAVRNQHRVLLYGSIVSYVDQQLGPTDVIGFLLTHQSYALHGSDLRGAVIAAPSAESESGWIALLRQARVTFVAVGPLLPAWSGSKELAWLSDPSKFERVSGSDWNREITLFRVK